MTVGSMLRERRLALSLELPEVAEYLRIKLSFLEAIENEDFRDLPGGTYATGFVKSYAKTLGLNYEAVADAFRKEQAVAASKAPLKVRSPLNDARIPTAGITILAGALLVAGWIGWSYLQHKPASTVELVPPLPDRLKEQTPEPQAIPQIPVTGIQPPAPVEPAISTAASVPEQVPAVGQPVAPVPAPVPSVAAVATPGKPPAPATMPFSAPADNEPDEAENDTDAPDQGPNMRTAPEPQETTGAAYGMPAGSGTVVLHALGDSWIQVRDGNHAVVYTGILHRGDVYRAPAGQGYTFVTGNAGGVSLDGASPLGGAGQVMHNVPLDDSVTKHP